LTGIGYRFHAETTEGTEIRSCLDFPVFSVCSVRTHGFSAGRSGAPESI
jgi:hypothetical protein